MRRQWAKENVDLTLLREDVKNFFVTKGFVVNEELSEGKYVFLIRSQPMHDVRDDITVVVSEGFNFEIEFVASDKARFNISFGFSPQSLVEEDVLEGLKSREVLERIEKVFWTYIETRISALTNPAEEY